jgi:hypothetical protein
LASGGDEGDGAGLGDRENFRGVGYPVAVEVIEKFESNARSRLPGDDLAGAGD